MRIRVITRTQAICLVLSLFLGVFAIGLFAGWVLFDGVEQADAAVDAFAPLAPSPVFDGEFTPLPTDAPPQTMEPEMTNLFSIYTPEPSVSLPSFTPAPSLINVSPEPSVTPTLAPGGFRIEVVKGPKQSGTAGQKRVLIYHSHTYEAYEQTKENSYEPTQQWRTKDNRYNVVRVGDELSKLLTAAGYTVVHDTTAYEPPVLSSSYTRSLKMLENSIAQGEKFDLYIDLHRDAYSSGMAGNNTVNVGDQQIAKLMMLIGKGTGLTGAGFDKRPDWEKNLAIAQRITDALNEQVQGICRPVNLTSNRYNQHIAPCCVLVEVGNNKNTLEEVLASVPYLSDAIVTALSVQQ